VFTSDFMLSERRYTILSLQAVLKGRALYAVNIKGLDPQEYLANTQRKFNSKRMWDNLIALEWSNLPFYITFTNVSQKNIDKFWNKYTVMFPKIVGLRRKQAFSINLVDYKALHYEQRTQ
jgi:hypothetical protein